MKILLIEDEKKHCEKYKESVDYLPYPVELSIVNGLKEALRYIEKEPTGIILLDLELHDSDGDGVLFLKKLRDMKITPKPYIIIITSNRSIETQSMVRDFGADYIFSKVKKDYSPRLVFDFAHCYFSRENKIESECMSIEDLVTYELEKIGFTYGVVGKNYLVLAITTVIHANKNHISLKRDVYPVIARQFKKSDESIEKAMRTAILKTWRITDLETLQKNYPVNIDYDTGYPTNKELIFYVAEKIKKGNAIAPPVDGTNRYAVC
jgi:CheY-like chemotaxis protein